MTPAGYVHEALGAAHAVLRHGAVRLRRVRAANPDCAVPATPDPAVKLLTEAVLRAERTLSALAGALPTPPSATALPPLDSVPAALQRTVTLDWIGPIETLAKDLARRADYRFLAAGPAPVRPLIVSIEADSVPLIAVMRDAGLQAGNTATVVVDADLRMVRLDWAAPPRTHLQEPGE